MSAQLSVGLKLPAMNGEPRRVIIRARVTDMEGGREERVKNFDQVFGLTVLERPLNLLLRDLPHDEMHFLPNCDSEDSVAAWFVYDLNCAGDLSKEDLGKISHEMYIPSLVNDKWYDIGRLQAGGLISDNKLVVLSTRSMAK